MVVVRPCVAAQQSNHGHFEVTTSYLRSHCAYPGQSPAVFHYQRPSVNGRTLGVWRLTHHLFGPASKVPSFFHRHRGRPGLLTIHILNQPDSFWARETAHFELSLFIQGYVVLDLVSSLPCRPSNFTVFHPDPGCIHGPYRVITRSAEHVRHWQQCLVRSAKCRTIPRVFPPARNHQIPDRWP